MKTKLSGILTLLLAFVVQFTFAQGRTITGTVSDDEMPLPGVSVLIVGTSVGTETDFDGNYAIEAATGDVLQFSFVGMTTVTRTVGNENVINVTLVSDDNTLDEVVVTAFGIKRQKKSLAYASTTVTGEELTEVSSTNPLESLSGKVAGVNITSPAQPGASSKVIFRGLSSITGSNNPLYIVDGSPFTDAASGTTGGAFISTYDGGTGINDLDPNSIETINFLKGASATSLYGSRGANGVIVITTKKGRGKLKVSVNSSIDFLEVSRVPHIQEDFGTGWSGQSYSFVTGEGGGAASNENGSWGARFDGVERPWSRVINNAQLIKPYVALHENQKDFYTTGISQVSAINLSAGSEIADVSFTYSHQDMDGVFPTDQDSFKKNTFGVNAGLNIDKFTMRVTANYVHRDQKAVPTGQGDQASFGPSLAQEIIQIPNDLSIPDMNTDNIFYSPSYFYTPYTSNPYESLRNNNVSLTKDRFYGNARFGYDFGRGLSATLQLGTDVDNEHTKRWGAIVEWIPGSPQDNAGSQETVGAVQEIKRTITQNDVYFNVNYNKDFGNKLKLAAFIGANYNERITNQLGVTVTDLDLPGYYELSNSASTPIIAQGDSRKVLLGYYAQAELSWSDRYFLNLTARNDQSSALPVDNNSYFYPSISGAAVVVDNGSTFLKLRAQFATVGNDTGSYQVFSTAGQTVNAGYFNQITYPFGGENSNEIFGRIENQELKPEITDEIEFGIDARFFRGRLTFDIALYDRKTTDLIVALPIARSTGYSVITGNFADVTNQGIELALNAKAVVSDNFRWDIGYTFSKNENEVTKVNNADGKVLINSAYDISYYAEEGRAMGAFYAPEAARTDSGQLIADPNTGYETYDGNETYVGDSQYDFIMGLQNTFQYKGFRLAVGLDWKSGGLMYSYTKRLSHFVGNGIETTYNDRNPWILPNSVVSDGAGGYVENTRAIEWDDVTAYYNGNNQPTQRTHLIDKSFIRLRDAVLSYDLPDKLLRPAGIEKVSFSIYGKNLALWTPAENPYVDPETSTYGRQIESEFGEFGTNPAQRSYGMGVRFTF